MMRAPIIALCVLLVSSLGCGSVEKDPKAAAKAAKSAAGNVGQLTEESKPVTPAKRTATSIVDDGDADTTKPDGNDQKGPGKLKGPKLDPDRKQPGVEVLEPGAVEPGSPGGGPALP